MLQKVLEFVQLNPGANSYDVCQKFGITRALSERLLETLEDAGELSLDRPAACGTGGSCGTGGGAAGKLQEMAQAARERAAARRAAKAAEAEQAQ